MQHQPKHYKWIFFFVILLMALSIAAPVLADYLGPNRTVTTTTSVCQAVLYECKEVNGHWKYKRMQDWSCPNSGDACAGYPSNSRPCSDESNVPGWEYCKKEESTQTTTVTYDPATISGSVQNCTVQNGWCVSPPNLSLSANEPLSGQSILLIEGTLNGGTFACPSGATSCSLPLHEGENTFNYWALSSWGDSSAMGTSAARVDTVAPNVGLDIRGTSGANGWYVSPLTITATGDDAMPGSGVASTLLSIDGGATWQPSLILSEGVYNAAVTVADNAGNVSTSAATLSVDTTTPSINMSVAGTAGKNGWYKSAIQVSALASDATSGVASFEVSADGAAYQTYTPISFSDGPHTIQFKAVDAAGNITETAPQTFYVDTLAPTVNLPASWQLGTNVPYDVLDEGSGLGVLRIVIEDEDEKYAKVAWNQEVSGSTYSQDIDWNGEFKDKTVAPPGTYLVWIKASDLAGNERFQLGKVIVPETNLFLSLLPTEEPAISASPVPPAELFEPEAVLPVTAPPTTDFGGETTETTGTTTHSLLLATGSAGAAAATTSGVLWGAAAAAAISAATAYALEADRKRKEAEEEQAARVRAEIAHDKAERAEKKQKQQENYNKQQALEQAILKQKQQAAYNARMEEKMAKRDQQDEANWVAAQAVIKKKQEQAASNARLEKKLAKLDAQDEANWAAVQKKLENKKKAEATTGYFNSEKQGDSMTTAKLKGPKVAAALALDGDPPEEPGFFEWFWNGAKAVWNGIFGSRQPAPPTSIQPDVDTLAKAYMTVIAQVTQTAQALPTSTPSIISTPTPFLTPTPVRVPLVVLTDGLNLRSQPTTNGFVLASIPKGGIVYLEQNSETKTGDGYCWHEVTYTDPKINARAVAASPDFLNPLSEFNRITEQGDLISYYNAVPGWDSKHIGNDFVPADSANPNPPVFASASGTVIRAGTQILNDKTVGYGNYVIIEYQAGSLPAPIHNLPEYKANDSLYAMYAHLKDDMSNILKPGINIAPGMQIGTMGDSGNTGNFTHLHLELRLGEPATDSNGLKNLNASNGDWYNTNRLPPLDPALIFTPKDTWTGWVAQSQWDAQSQCATGDPYLGAP